MKLLVLPVTIAAFVAVAGAACAEMYVDYTPQKGAWHVVTAKVDPNHIDDYLVGLKKTWVPGEEISKKRGLIDSYTISVKLTGSDGGANVMMVEHIPSLALLEPDKARDQAIEKEVYEVMAKDKMEAQVKDFEKYRVFISDEYWTDISYSK